MPTPTEAKQVFNGIAWRYDLANRVISLGLDWSWRHELSRLCSERKPQRVLDVACGTGDQILSLKRFLNPECKIVGLDLLEKMVVRAKKKVKSKGPQMNWFLGNGIELPFKENSFDAMTISFGLRNLPSIESYLEEAKRVLRPNGKVWVLEFSQPKPWFRKIYYTYLRHVLPVIGKVLTGSRSSYDYLASTIERFPNQKALSQVFEKVGFQKTEYVNLCQGIVAIHSGELKR